MAQNPLQSISELLKSKVAEKKQQESQKEQLGWISVTIDEALERVSDKMVGWISSISDDATDKLGKIIGQIKFEPPQVTVNVPEIKVPEAIVRVELPEIRVPEAKVTVEVPEIKVPEAHVTVDIPEIKIPTPRFKTRSDTYTSTGNGTTVDISTGPLESFSIQVKGTGAAAATWDVRLEGSLNGTDFTQILQHTNTTGDGAVVFSGTTDSPCLYFRSRCAGLGLGPATNIVVTILGNT